MELNHAEFNTMLDSPHSPAVLAGILGVNVSLIYQMRQSNKLPPDSNASYRACLQHHLTYYKNAAARRASNITDAAALQKIKLDEARTEREWLSVRTERRELVDTKELAMQLEPFFNTLRSQLVALTRELPETIPSVDRMLQEWSLLGEQMQFEAENTFTEFVNTQTSKVFDFEGKQDV